MDKMDRKLMQFFAEEWREFHFRVLEFGELPLDRLDSHLAAV